MRLIPAHAGKTAVRRLHDLQQRAHPRSRGENVLPLICSIACRGSSPLTRGKPLRYRDRDYPRGLIPAHAGKTTPSVWPPLPAWAHPRSRGENTAYMRDGHPEMGSSPLTRGKHGVYAGRPPRNGLIPAHAGKTPRPAPRGALGWAHPRSRGENWISGAQLRGSEGSSPLTRGKRGDRCLAADDPGLIPAHAGKTHRPAGRPCRVRAHPRSRGENL